MNQNQNQQKRNSTLGKLGEDIARQRLQENGYLFISANFHTRFGEIDLIVSKGTIIFFVEVKTRSNYDCGSPESAISRSKLQKVQKAAQAFLLEHPQYQNYQPQIDVIAIIFSNGEVKEFTHHQAVYL